MNETEKISESKNEAERIKINKSDFFNLLIATINLILLIISFTQLRNITILSYLFGVFFIGILSIGTIVLFHRKNPYYTYFCYGFIICGFIGALNIATVNVFFLIFLFILLTPEVLFIYTTFANMFYTTDNYFYSHSRTHQAQLIREIPRRYIEESKKRRDIEEFKKTVLRKKFKPNLIALISFFCSLGLILTIAFSV